MANPDLSAKGLRFFKLASGQAIGNGGDGD